MLVESAGRPPSGGRAYPLNLSLKWRVAKEACHSTKRTHFAFASFLAHHFYLQKLVSFAERFANGFVLENEPVFAGSKGPQMQRKLKNEPKISGVSAPISALLRVEGNGWGGFVAQLFGELIGFDGVDLFHLAGGFTRLTGLMEFQIGTDEAAPCFGVVGPELEGLREEKDGFVVFALLLGDDAEIEPCIGIIRLVLERQPKGVDRLRVLALTCVGRAELELGRSEERR